MQFLPAKQGDHAVRRAVVAIALASACVGCRAGPSASEIENLLQHHQEIRYRVIEEHPAEMIAALNKAAQITQTQMQKNASRHAEAKTEDEFRNPKVPSRQHRIAFGNASAPITIVEYSDFQCRYCRRERDVLLEVMKHYGDRVRLVVKQTPLEMHPHAMLAVLMYEAVARQDPAKAFKLYDVLFDNQAKQEAQGKLCLGQAVRSVGADMERAKVDAKSPAIRAIVDADLEEGRRFGFLGTPGFLVNGVSLDGPFPAAAFERIIDRH